MSRKKNIFIILLLFRFCLVANSQTVEYITGEKIQPDDSSSFQIFSYDSTRLFAFRVNSRERQVNYKLQVFSRDSVRRISTIPIPFTAPNARFYELEYLFAHEDYFQLLYSWFDPNRQKNKLEMINFNFSGEKIGETNTIDSSESSSARKGEAFSVFDIPKEKQFICYSEKYMQGKLMINVDHFDYAGNKLRSTGFRNVKLPHITYSVIEKDGGMIYVTRGRTDAENRDWRLNIYSPESDTVLRILLQKPDEENYHVSEHFKSFHGADGNLFLLSPYSEVEDSKYSNGVYLVELDLKNHTLIKEEFISFNNKIDNTVGNEEDFSMASCIITNLVDLQGGKKNILFESRLMKNETFYEEYHIGNILSVEVDSNFKTLSICRISKKQVMTTGKSGFTGFTYLNKNEKLFLIYNELEENINSGNQRLKKVRNSKVDETSVAMVTLENNKITDKQVLIEKKDSLITDGLHIYSSLRTNNQELYTVRQIGDDRFLTKIFIKEE